MGERTEPVIIMTWKTSTSYWACNSEGLPSVAGVATELRADVAAIAKRNLKAGEILDGEGGYTVTGGLRPAKASLASGYLPLGLAHNVKLKNAIADGTPITWSDVEIDETTIAYKLRRWMEEQF